MRSKKLSASNDKIIIEPVEKYANVLMMIKKRTTPRVIKEDFFIFSPYSIWEIFT